MDKEVCSLVLVLLFSRSLPGDVQEPFFWFNLGVRVQCGLDDLLDVDLGKVKFFGNGINDVFFNHH